jgi:quinol monooxygenase YgiN
MTSATHVHVVASLQAQADRSSELAAVLVELAAASRRQPGNLRFEVHRNLADPSQMITVEQWDSAASADAHMASPHVAAALARLGPLLGAPPQIVRHAQVA